MLPLMLANAKTVTIESQLLASLQIGLNNRFKHKPTTSKEQLIHGIHDKNSQCLMHYSVQDSDLSTVLRVPLIRFACIRWLTEHESIGKIAFQSLFIFLNALNHRVLFSLKSVFSPGETFMSITE